MGKRVPKILSQAVIVVTEYAGGHLVIRTDNDTTSEAARFADALVNMGKAVIENPLKDKPACPHPWHSNPGLITPCPECGAGGDGDVVPADAHGRGNQGRRGEE